MIFLKGDKKTKRPSGLRRLMRMLLLALILFFGLILLESSFQNVVKKMRAGQEKAQTEKIIKTQIRKYNTNLIKTYQYQKSDLMVDLTTPKELGRIRLYIAYNYFEKKRILISKLLNLTFKKNQIKDKKAFVSAEEDWTYYHIDIKAKKRIDQTKKIKQKVTYTLKKQGKQWLIDEVKVL